MITKLPKPVVDRIRRYATEGRAPLTRSAQGGYQLVATAMGQLPVVILSGTGHEFTAIRSAALIEWKRAAKRRNGLHR